MLTHPEAHCTKKYIATLRDAPECILSATACEEFARGIVLHDGQVCRPARLEILESGPPTRVAVYIHEGMYHQVHTGISMHQ